MATPSNKSRRKTGSPSFFKRTVVRAKTRILAFRAKRPHRSFRRTKRRDAKQPLNLPGYFAFTHEVWRIFWRYKRPLLLITLLYIILYVVFVGLGSQSSYDALIDTLDQTGGDIFQGSWGEVGKAGLLFVTVATSGLNTYASEVQQIMAVFVFLLVWLTTIWLLRNLLANKKVKVRDSVYSSGAPIVSTFLTLFVFLIQLAPVGIAILGYIAATDTGLLDGGVEAMLFWMAAILLGTLSLFWVTSTILALIIVTIPGTYPMRALAIAGDMVTGRRVKILLRWLWLLLCVIVLWAVVLIPIILFDGFIKGQFSVLASLPIVPVVSLSLTGFTAVWVTVYAYVLYRRIVDEDVAHA